MWDYLSANDLWGERIQVAWRGYLKHAVLNSEGWHAVVIDGIMKIEDGI